MKKIAVIISMLVLLVLSANAAGEGGEKISITLPYATAPITVDGKADDNEWNLSASVKLDKENTGTWGNMSEEEHITPVEAYFMWNDNGLYVYADITDNDPDFGTKKDCFEFSLNPGGLIPADDPLEGMFFMCWPDAPDGENTGKVTVTRHNIDYESKSGFKSDIEARYTITEKGWQMEAVVPWEYICPAERVVGSGNRTSKTGVLSKFDRDGDGAYLTATVCYLNGVSGEKNYRAVYRTATGLEAGNFSTSSYNVYMTLGERKESSETTSVKQDTMPDTDIKTTADEKNDKSNTATAVIIVACTAIVIGGTAFMIIYSKKK